MIDEHSGEKLVFHYSREQRLNTASKAVRELNSGIKSERMGIFRRLTATKSSTFLLIAIILLGLFALFIRLFDLPETGVSLAGNRLKLETIRYDDKIFLFIDKEAISATAYTGSVNLSLAAGIDTRIEFSTAKKERIKAVLPDQKDRLNLIFQAGSDQSIVRLNPE